MKQLGMMERGHPMRYEKGVPIRRATPAWPRDLTPLPDLGEAEAAGWTHRPLRPVGLSHMAPGGPGL